jgi:hypothetical protein
VKLIEFGEVHRIAKYRDCSAVRGDEHKCEIVRKSRSVNCYVSKPNLWRPIAVFKACQEAAGKKPVEVGEVPKDLNTTTHGLDEALIAEALAADGIRPYWRGLRTMPFEAVIRCAGDPTKAIRRLMVSDDPTDRVYPPGATLAFSDTHPSVRLAARAVVDAGLAILEFGPRGGWSRARVIWNDEMYVQQRMSAAEDDAIGDLTPGN